MFLLNNLQSSKVDDVLKRKAKYLVFTLLFYCLTHIILLHDKYKILIHYFTLFTIHVLKFTMKTNYKSEINGLYQVHKFFSRQDISKLINHDLD